MASIQGIEVIRYSLSAFYSEHSKNLTKAQSLHESAVFGLKAIAEDTWHDQEARTICDKQAKFHASRYHLIRSILDENHEIDLPFVLPTTLSAEESMNCTLKNGDLAIGLEESLLAEYLVEKDENPDLAVPNQIKHLFDSTTLSPYALSLDSNLTSKQYKIAVDMDSTNYSYWPNAHPIDQPDQTCYRLRVNRWGKTQFENIAFYRATEFIIPCIDINITSVASTGDRKLSSMKSRSIEYTASNSSRAIVEHPNSLEKRTWGSQKFMYAGRSFVWITPEGKWDVQLPMLYEVENGMGDNTRKGGSKVVGNKLCWGGLKPGKDASATVTIVGGVDQLFEKLLFASQMTKMAIFLFGHDI
ncbi:uncharacterized protein DFL_005286 [Arthrobotrys flagrans]|uniref:Uncharacterized protein n=1 Tax=Arthrobotrys flagrans TaxID=97331 RepID=A0A437A7P2_ARTFL|nr:hypothetical protein DFL_005286 [Arthrobotrys flagrans]